MNEIIGEQKMRLKFTLLILILILSLNYRVALAHGPHDVVDALAISPNYQADKTVFSSLSHLAKHLLKTTNRGITWKQSQIGLSKHKINFLAISPFFQSDKVLFTATDGGGIFKSTDGGRKWAAVNNGLTDLVVNTLSVSPDYQNDQTLFAGTRGGGVFKSIDGGVSWNSFNSGLASLNITTISITPSYQNDGTVFVGAKGGSVYKSTNGGATWNPYNNGLGALDVTAISISPSYTDTNDQTAFAGTDGGGVFKTTDGGASWVSVNNGLTDMFVTTIAISPEFNSDQAVFIATNEGGVFRSTDGGTSWVLASNGIDMDLNPQTSVHFRFLAVSPNFKNDRTLFIATFDGLYRSINGGNSWYQMTLFPNTYTRSVIVSPSFSEDQFVVDGTYGGGINISHDGGSTWEPSNLGLLYMFIDPMVLSPNFNQDGTIFSVACGNAYKSVDYGASWIAVRMDPGGACGRSIAISPEYATDQTLFIGTGSNEPNALYKSVDGGMSYSPVDINAQYHVLSIAFSPDYAVDQTIFVGSIRGVFRSNDSGLSWVQVGYSDYEVSSLAISPSFQSDNTLFASTGGGGIFKSVDGGNQWLKVNNGIDDLIVNSLSISPDYEIDETIFAGTKWGGIYKSIDGGNSWSFMYFRGKLIDSVAISNSYSTDQTLFAGTWDGVYKSVDGGSSWTFVSTINRYEDKSDQINYLGTWNQYNSNNASGKTIKYSTSSTSKVTLYFLGTSISWIGLMNNQHGISDVYVDGVFQASVDQYSPAALWQQELFTVTGLSGDVHRITIKATPDKNPDSRANAISLDAFDVGY